jgi:hypothetical protein
VSCERGGHSHRRSTSDDDSRLFPRLRCDRLDDDEDDDGVVGGWAACWFPFWLVPHSESRSRVSVCSAVSVLGVFKSFFLVCTQDGKGEDGAGDGPLPFGRAAMRIPSDSPSNSWWNIIAVTKEAVGMDRRLVAA